MPKKKEAMTSPQSDNETDELPIDAENLYTVETIVQHKIGKLFYFIHWAGYSDDDNSWEAEENVFCDDLVEDYFKKLGTTRDEVIALATSDKRKRGSLNGKRQADISYSQQTEEEGFDEKETKLLRKNLDDTPSSAKKGENGGNKRSAEDAILDTFEEKPAKQSRTVAPAAENGGVNGRAKGRNGSEANDEMTPKKALAKRKTQKPPGEEQDDDLLEFGIEISKDAVGKDSWEEWVTKIETVEQKKDGLMVFLHWKDGTRSVHDSKVTKKAIPNMMIDFYEAHLRFKSP
ncbi:hypothetical protein BJ742DRAFT_201320 [Cladochytrium replicatum]|nr:hypothetical protein BJ742DRAFT_201320 [Cladochytrium replicatum]